MPTTYVQKTDDVDYVVEKIRFLSNRVKEGLNIIGQEVDKAFDQEYEQMQSGSGMAIGKQPNSKND